MTNLRERESKRADELKPGDWIAAMQIRDDDDKPVEFLGSFPYCDADGDAVLLVYRVRDMPRAVPEDADKRYYLATEAELATHRADLERAVRIAELRALADWLEANEWAPIPNHFDVSAHLDEPAFAPAVGYAKVREVAARIGVEPEERLDDRTVVGKVFGHVDYKVIAWHLDGRPGESSPDPGAELAGLRADAKRGTAAEGMPDLEPSSAAAGLAALAGEVRAAKAEERGSREPESGPVVRYFSFGHGQTDPDTGEELLDRYVTVIAPTAQDCRDAMIASRFGREWAFEYIPGTPQANEWIFRWDEHERIDAMPASAE